MRRHLATLLAGVLLGCEVAAAQAPQAPAAPGQPQGAPPAGRGRGAPPPATRIANFSAMPATIRAGESAVLSWVIENPPSATGFGGFGTIDQGIGNVTPRGTIRVTPKATTTYTLTAGTLTKSVTVTIPGTTPVTTAAAAASTPTGIPRTPDGKPDFTGVFGWANLFGGAGRGGVIAGVAGPQLKPGAEKYRVNRAANPQDTGATSDCMPLIPPNSFGVPYEFQIIQNKDYVVIFHEYPGTFRIVPLNNEPHMVDPDPAWLGDSVGKWDGDTLVIDTIGYNDKTELNGYKHTEDLHTVERLTRVNGGVDYELTVEDPNVFVAPWKVTRQFRISDPPRKRIFEFVCENNRDYRPLFGDKK